MQRSFLIFQNSIHSKETYTIYKYALDKFLDYYKLRDYDSLARMESIMLQTMVEDYIMFKKSKGLSRSTIKTSVASLELFCDTNDLSLNWKKIKRLLPQQTKRTGGKAYTTKNIQKMLSSTTETRTKALIHFLASTGVRVGALPELKLKHIRDMPLGCKAVIVYPEDKEEYITFLTPEASSILFEYLEQRKKDGEHLYPDSPLFRETYSWAITKPKHLSIPAIKAIVYRVVKKADLRSNNDGSRKDIQLDHGFRKRFNTILKTTNGIKLGLAEKMMGHSVTIPLDDVYLDASIEKLFDEFNKAISELTINDNERLKTKNEKLEQEKSELEITRAEMEEMKREWRIVKKYGNLFPKPNS